MESIWFQLSKKRYQNKQTALPNKCEICIVGGGLSGLYSAVLLAQHGHEVVLLEASDFIGQGATSLSTGKLTIQHGILLQKLSEDVRGIYVSANNDAIVNFKQRLPEQLFTERNAYIYSENSNDSEQLKVEYDIYERLQLPAFATNETELPFEIDLAIALKNQYEIDPYAVQLALVELAKQHGATILTGQRVQHIDHDGNYVTIGEQRLHFQQLILATHYPIDAIPALQIMKLSNSRSYLCAAAVLEPLTSYYISAATQSRTIRSATINDQHYMLYGGTSHLAGVNSKNKKYYETIEQEFTKHFEVEEIPYKWSNQDVQTFDHLPFVGPIRPNIFVATGYRKWGLSQSLVAAEILMSYINGSAHPLQPFVTPKRINLLPMLQVAGFTFAQFLNGYINRPTTPVCTHLGCKTRWNNADETWDCPCHGSRFSSTGEVIEGPAVQPLKLKNK